MVKFSDGSARVARQLEVEPILQMAAAARDQLGTMALSQASCTFCWCGAFTPVPVVS
jgi:hypothetical protein